MKVNVKERMHGIGMELIKVVFMFSLVSEALVCFLAALQKDVEYAKDKER